MNILFFSPYYAPYLSGITVYPKLIFSNLAKNHSITILTFKHLDSLSTKEKLDNTTIIRMPFLLKISKGFISPQSIIQFIKWLKKSDIVIINLPNVEGLALAILAKVFGKPSIAIFHCRVDLGSSPIQKLITYIAQLSTNLQLHLATHIIAYTKDYISSMNWPHKFHQKIIIQPPPVVKHIINPDYSNKLKQIKGSSLWIGFSGRVAKEKGIEYLIKAINQIDSKHDIQLVFAGPYGSDVAGENDYYQTILKQLKNSHIKYHFLGSLHQGQLGAFYKSIDLLVLPSINQTEAFGMVQLEAMKLRKPVIATNLPGVRSLIKETGMGLVVSPKDVIGLKQAIQTIINNPKPFVSQEKLRKAQNMGTIKEVVKTYEKIINQYN